jgi:hypothetical protein
MKRLLLLLLIFTAFTSTRVLAEAVPVLLMVKSSEQSDTSGCNFVEELTELIYNEIINKKVTLWDSQSKEIPISPSTLVQIEKNSRVSFRKLETVFIYELWEAGKKEVTTRTLGFSFTHRGEQGDVSLGYVVFLDV